MTIPSRIGFTGTRSGMTGGGQKSTLLEFLYPCRGRVGQEAHHGDCIGADADFHRIIGEFDCFLRVIHPPVDERLRAFCKGYRVEVRPPKTHFARNRDIVNETDLLIATPWQETRPAPKTGGGTWYTIEYAEKHGKPVAIVWPNGHVDITPARVVPAVPS